MKLKILIPIFTSFILLLSSTPAAALPSTPKPYSAPDAVVQEFIAENLPGTAKPVECSTICYANKGSENITAKVDAEIYTFRDGTSIYTVVDFQSLGDLSASKEASFTVVLNDYALLTNAFNGAFYVKNKPESAWKFNNTLHAIPSLYSLALYDSEIQSTAKYFRIIFYFEAEYNSNAQATSPQYTILYTQPDTPAFDLPFYTVWLLLALLIVLFLVLPRWRKARKHR